MRIALGGINTESSTFARHTTRESDFTIAREDALREHYAESGALGDASDVAWVPLVRAVAPPGGPVDAAFADAIETELLQRLELAHAEAPLDGVYLDIHGAMTVHGRENFEEHLLERVRAIVGPRALIATSMDPHGNVSRRFIELVDIATSHRHSPHIDVLETRVRAIALLVDALRSGRRPAKAWVRVPVLLSGERTSTLGEPGRAFFLDTLAAARKDYRVDDAAIWVGRAWADETRCAAAVLAIGTDAEEAAACAEHLAREFWARRTSFQFIMENNGTWDEALDFARASARPVFISDSGDNVTAGAGGDMTWALHATARREHADPTGLRYLFAGLVDPASVAAAAAAGLDARLERAIGAHDEDRFGDPFPGPWRVARILHNAERAPVGALLEQGRISVLVQTGRAPYVAPDDPAFAPGMLPDVAYLAPDGFDVVVVKNGYQFPSQRALAASSFLAVTPGGTDLDFTRLPYTRRPRPMFPLDADFEVDLTPVVFPAAPLTA